MDAQRPPCEIAVWQILPSIHSEIAKRLATIGLPQKVISKSLGISQPAVSQYISNKRGTTLTIDTPAQTLIQLLAEDVANGVDVDLIQRVCKICEQIRGDERCPMPRCQS